MAGRAEQLLSDFEQAVEEFTKVVEAWPDDKWTTAHGDEGWTVAATAQHVSGQFPLEMEYLTAAAEGRDLPTYTWDDINEKNDTRAGRNTTASKAEVLDELRREGEIVTDFLRGLSDEQLDRTYPFALAGGAEVSTQQMIEGGLLIDHVRAHTKSIQAAS